MYNSPWLSKISSPLHPHLFAIKDTVGLGHCGFQAVAQSLGFEGEVQGYQRVRGDMHQELSRHQTFYEYVFAESFSKDQKVKASRSRSNTPFLWVLDNILCSQAVAPPATWLTFPIHGDVLANAYERPVYFYDPAHPDKGMSFYPVFGGKNSNPPITIAKVDQNHFVGLEFMGDRVPAPPYAPWFFMACDEFDPAAEEHLRPLDINLWDRLDPTDLTTD